MVLAAGKSVRMGQPKQLLPFGDGTILEQVIENLSRSSLDEIVVVLGYHAEEIAPKIADKPVKVVVNPSFRQGMSSSIKSGLSQVAESSAIMIFLGDQPLIGEETINKLVKSFSKGEQGIVAPLYKGARGHPVIFDARYRAELSRLEGDVGGKRIVEAHPEDTLEVEVNSNSVISDIDCWGDYKRGRDGK